MAFNLLQRYRNTKDGYSALEAAHQFTGNVFSKLFVHRRFFMGCFYLSLTGLYAAFLPSISAQANKNIKFAAILCSGLAVTELQKRHSSIRIATRSYFKLRRSTN